MNDDKTRIRPGIPLDHVHVIHLENSVLNVAVSPETGGRFVSIFHKLLRREFLWKNDRLPLQRAQPGEAYDPNFYGGIDEVIPGDMPETIAGIANPDHGALWTLPLDWHVADETLVLQGRLPAWELGYEKRVSLHPGTSWMHVDYRIVNHSGERRIFLWKLHAALAISAGDRIVCPAKTAAVADQQWSRWVTREPFPWPQIAGARADQIPPADGTTDFLFLYDLHAGQIAIQSPVHGSEFSIVFDPRVFPYVCYFASYGGFEGHYTAVLEPCTAMPLSVNEAFRLGQCSYLEPGAALTTRISMYAGPISGSSGDLSAEKRLSKPFSGSTDAQ